jgi:adenylate kinase family enzyme
MPLYFVTGLAGSGKSSICKELKSRGYEAYDTDDDGFSKWQDIKTGHIHPKSTVKKEDRTVEFLKNHRWNAPKQEVAALATRASDKPIFLCGVADNTKELLQLFDKVLALTIDDKTLTYRLQTRTDNDWGKQPHELRSTLEQNRLSKAFYKKNGYIIIDATQPFSSVVDEILTKAL